jgi:hypothetical protein
MDGHVKSVKEGPCVRVQCIATQIGTFIVDDDDSPVNPTKTTTMLEFMNILCFLLQFLTGPLLWMPQMAGEVPDDFIVSVLCNY